MINTADELIESAQKLLGKSSSNITDDGYSLGAESAMAELGWEYPISHPFKVMWAKNRCARHCLLILKIESAHKFRYKDIHLQNRFSHYDSLIKQMDLDFEKAKEEYPEMFPAVIDMSEEMLSSSMSYYIPNLPDYDDLGRPI